MVVTMGAEEISVKKLPAIAKVITICVKKLHIIYGSSYGWISSEKTNTYKYVYQVMSESYMIKIDS